MLIAMQSYNVEIFFTVSPIYAYTKILILTVLSWFPWQRVIASKEASYWLRWSHRFESFTATTMTWLTVYLCHKWPRICSTCRKHNHVLSHSRFIIGFVIRRMPLVEDTTYLSGAPEFLPVFSRFVVPGPS